MAGERIVVAHLGARRHYAECRLPSGRNRLERFFTDICANKGLPNLLNLLPLSFQSDPLKRLTGRRPPGLDPGLITHFPSLGLRYAWLRSRSSSPSDIINAHLWAGQNFCRLILKHGLGAATGVYTFNSAGLELLRYARRRGLAGISDQTIAPMKMERLLLAQEEEKWPGWETHSWNGPQTAAYIEREQAEWQEAQVILCGSPFVVESVGRCGGPVEKCRVVQFGQSFTGGPPTPPSVATSGFGQGEPLKVLTVGAVGLRKGSPYVMECARALGGQAQFRMVGPLIASPQALAALARHVELVGPVPRSEIQKHYLWADVFLLPSIIEGSAMVCFEALAHGLPVVTTANAGSVVRDGREGYIVPASEWQPACEKLALLARDAGLRRELSLSAARRAAEFTPAAQSATFFEALGMTD